MQKILPFSFFPLLVVAHALAYHSLLSVKGFDDWQACKVKD